MVIQFDNGEKWLAELRGSGWIKDCKEGESWRMKKFRGLTSLDVKKARDRKKGKKRKICEKCGSEFASEVGWLRHVRVADVKSWKTCLKVSSKREGPQEQRRFWKGVGEREL